MRPLRAAFPDLKRHTHLLLGGASHGRRDGDASRDGRHWVSGMGLMNGRFQADYLGIHATGQPVSLPRVAEGSGQDRVRPSEGRISGLTVDMSLVAKKAGGTEVPRGSCRE